MLVKFSGASGEGDSLASRPGAARPARCSYGTCTGTWVLPTPAPGQVLLWCCSGAKNSYRHMLVKFRAHPGRIRGASGAHLGRIRGASGAQPGRPVWRPLYAEIGNNGGTMRLHDVVMCYISMEEVGIKQLYHIN